MRDVSKSYEAELEKASLTEKGLSYIGSKTSTQRILCSKRHDERPYFLSEFRMCPNLDKDTANPDLDT